MRKLIRLREPEINEGANSAVAKLTEQEVKVMIRILYKDYMPIDQLAEVFGVSWAAVYAIRENKTWRYISRLPGMVGFEIKRRSKGKGGSA